MPTPELTAILVTRTTAADLRHTLRYLQRQSAVGRLEVVIVAPRLDDAALPPEALAGFHSAQGVAVGPVLSRERAAAAGVRLARAPAVVFVEDHVFAHPDWAATLIAAHQDGWAAVGPLLENLCPGVLALTAHVGDYGLWSDPTLAGPTALLSRSNTAYDRAALLALPGALEDWLEHQPRLQRHLLAHGRRMLFEPRARLWHLGPSRWGPWARVRVDMWWVYGAGRAQDWPPARRWLYVAAAPLIPLLNFPRLAALARGGGAHGWALVRLLPTLALMAVLAALGEVGGYLFDPAPAQARMDDVEFDRHRFLSAHDRAALEDYLEAVLPRPPRPAAMAAESVEHRLPTHG